MRALRLTQEIGAGTPPGGGVSLEAVEGMGMPDTAPPAPDFGLPMIPGEGLLATG